MMMRVLLAAGAALAFAACGEKTPAETATTEPAVSTPAEPAAPSAPATPVPGAKAADAAAFAKFVPWNHARPEIKKSGSGMEYVVLASGPAGAAPPKASQEVEVFYEGRLNTGGPAFDSAFERNESAVFPVGGVVPGFSEALQLMRPGDRWLVFIPWMLGYGAEGRPPKIPGQADMVFEIEMVAVVP